MKVRNGVLSLVAAALIAAVFGGSAAWVHKNHTTKRAVRVCKSDYEWAGYPQMLSDAVRENEVIILGTVTDIRRTGPIPVGAGPGGPAVATYHTTCDVTVKSYLKGSGPLQIKYSQPGADLSTSLGAVFCTEEAPLLEVGGTYILMYEFDHDRLSQKLGYSIVMIRQPDGTDKTYWAGDLDEGFSACPPRNRFRVGDDNIVHAVSDQWQPVKDWQFELGGKQIIGENVADACQTIQGLVQQQNDEAAQALLYEQRFGASIK